LSESLVFDAKDVEKKEMPCLGSIPHKGFNKNDEFWRFQLRLFSSSFYRVEWQSLLGVIIQPFSIFSP
jgi:hypothetical protein